MPGVSKGLAEYLINLSERNPKFALLIVPLGLALAYWGVSDARYYKALQNQPTQTMKEVAVVSITNNRGFSVPHVVGKTATGEVSIPISYKAAEKIPTGENLDFVETTDNPPKQVLRSTLDEQLSQIYFTIAGIPFNFIGILGSLIILGSCAWALLAKPKADEPSPPEAQTPQP